MDGVLEDVALAACHTENPIQRRPRGPTLGRMPSSPWRVYFYVGHYAGGRMAALDVHHRLTRVVPDAGGRQELWLPVHPLDAVKEALPLLDPVYAHYAAQWPKIMSDYVIVDDEELAGRGFFLEGENVPEQIADPSHADELDVIAWGNIPPDLRREWEELGGRESLTHALTDDDRLIDPEYQYALIDPEWYVFDWCVPASEVGIEPYLG